MASQQSPPKPWERAGSGGTSTALASSAGVTTAPGSFNPTSVSTTLATTTTNSSNPPAIPERPSSLSSVVNRTASSYSNPASSFANRPYGSSPYGSSPYGYGGGSTFGSMYSSPYSRFGGGSMYGGSMYGGGMYGGGMGGIGGMGGYGSMYGNGMYGGGMGGVPGDPNDPNNSLTNNFQQSTQATFQIIESIVGAFGGFAQMLESTYMATHSSFFAMVSVAEQFGNLRTTLGSVLGIFTLLRWLRTLLAKITGRPPPADATALTPSAFAAFTGTGTPHIPPGQPGHVPPKPSKKPFIVFMLAVFGLPYLMGKLIRTLARSQEEAAAAAQQQQQQLGPNGQPLPPGSFSGDAPRPLDPSKLDFCRVLWDFPPADALASFSPELDLQVKRGDLVAVLDKANPDAGSSSGADGDWWRCRARDGRMGYLPAVYLETIQRPKAAPQIMDGSASAPGSRAQTMSAASAGSRAHTMVSSTLGEEGRAQTMDSATSLGSVRSAVSGKGKPEIGGKGKGELTVEGFQKSGFYNP